MRKHLLIWRLWRAVNRERVFHPIYSHAQGRSYTLPHILEAGFVWTLYIARTISREHENETYELLAVTPDGPLGTGIMMSSGVMHRLVEVTQYLGLLAWILRFVVLGMWLGSTVIRTENAAAALLYWFSAVIPLVGLWALHHYDISLSVLLGNLIPAVTRDRNTTTIFATSLHLFLLMVPIVLVVIGFQMALLLGEGSYGVFLLLSVVNIAVMVALCEGIARLLWHRLLTILDVSAADAEIVLDGALN